MRGKKIVDRLIGKMVVKRVKTVHRRDDLDWSTEQEIILH